MSETRTKRVEDYNWKMVGPGGCDTHCVESPCGECITGMTEFQYKRSLEFERKRDAFLAHTGYRETHGECPDDGVFCEACCEHEEHDHGVCNECEADISGELAGKAESAFEGDR